MFTQNRYKVLHICVILNPRLLQLKSWVLPAPTIHCLISSHLCLFDMFCDLSAGSILKEWKASITNGSWPPSAFCLLLQGFLLVAAQTLRPSLQPPFYQHTLTMRMLKMTLGFLWGSGIHSWEEQSEKSRVCENFQWLKKENEKCMACRLSK